jgi:transcriptional regulator with XRE-family HTH domain
MDGTELLRHLRGLHFMTLSQLATKMRTTSPQLSAFELGKVDVSAGFIARYAKALRTNEEIVRLGYLQAVCLHAKTRLKSAQSEIRGLMDANAPMFDYRRRKR